LITLVTPTGPTTSRPSPPGAGHPLPKILPPSNQSPTVLAAQMPPRAA